jgi:hypothetical protein
MKDLGNFFGHLVYFTAISYILWPFGIVCSHFGTFSPFFGMSYHEKSGIPGLKPFESRLEKLINI